MAEVSRFLGNTPALACSACVDAQVDDAYESGRAIASTTRRSFKTLDERQTALERATLKPLRES